MSPDVEEFTVVQRRVFHWPARSSLHLAVKTVKKILLASFIVGAQSAAAVSCLDAGENILYLEHARLSAEHCEAREIPAGSAFRTWKR